MSSHVHHSIPKSRGGTDEEWNLVELDPYTHAYEHALDFVLFDHAPQFDFRHEAWPLLPEGLRKAVLNRKAEWCANFFVNKPRPPEICRKISESKLGIPNSESAKIKMSEAKKGDKHPFFGKKRPQFGRNISKEKNGKSKKVEVTYPDGSLKNFYCTKEAGAYLNCSPSSVAKWAGKNYTPKVGKFSGYTFRYI